MKLPEASYYVTDFGVLELSDKTTAWLDRNCPDWSKPEKFEEGRSKKAERARDTYRKFEHAVRICAWIEWESGGLLERF